MSEGSADEFIAFLEEPEYHTAVFNHVALIVTLDDRILRVDTDGVGEFRERMRSWLIEARDIESGETFNALVERHHKEDRIENIHIKMENEDIDRLPAKHWGIDVMEGVSL